MHWLRTVGKYTLKCGTGISRFSKEPTRKLESTPGDKDGRWPQLRLGTHNTNRSVLLESVWELQGGLLAREAP